MHRIMLLGALLSGGCSSKTADTAQLDGDDTAGGDGTTDDSATDDSAGGDEDDTGDEPHDDTGGDDSGGDDSSSPDDSGGDDTASGDCAAGDLVLVAEVRDSAGAAGTSFAGGTDLVFAGIVQNPCDVEISFDTASACLADSWQVLGSAGVGIGTAEVCAAVVTTWVVPPGDSVETTLAWGKLPPDSWELTIDFAGVMPVASSTFEVY